MSAHLYFPHGFGREGRRYNKIDFADILKHDLERVRSVRAVSVRVHIEGEPLGLWVQVRQHLRIVDEDVDVETFSVADLKHQRGTATETPPIEQ